jgi:hypothetical protein
MMLTPVFVHVQKVSKEYASLFSLLTLYMNIIQLKIIVIRGLLIITKGLINWNLFNWFSCLHILNVNKLIFVYL